MDALKDKSMLEYSRVSRYSQFPYYYNTNDNKYMMGTTSWLNTDCEYVSVEIKPTDSLTSLAQVYYGEPDYWWIIADFNKIIDAFTPIYGKYDKLKIPSLSQITFK